MPRLLTPLALLALLLVGPGCAFLNRDNLLLFDAFEKNVVPDADTRTGLHLATAPLTYPTGLLLLLLDTALVHPALVVDDAWKDTLDACWDRFEWDTHYVTELTVLPARAAGTPVVYLTCLLGRALFDIPPYGSKREGEKGAGDRADATRDPRALIDAARSGDADTFDATLTNIDDPSRLAQPQLTALIDALAGAPSRTRQSMARRLRRCRSEPGRSRLVRAMLEDTDPVVRWLALGALPRGWRMPTALRETLLEDASEAVRERAARVSR